MARPADALEDLIAFWQVSGSNDTWYLPFGSSIPYSEYEILVQQGLAERKIVPRLLADVAIQSHGDAWVNTLYGVYLQLAAQPYRLYQYRITQAGLDYWQRSGRATWLETRLQETGATHVQKT